MKETEKKSIKKPYHSPKVFVYGDIGELTESVGMTGMTDGGYSGVTQLKTR